ncbi:MAG: glycosyltransferase family 4 protein [Deltaproteobacteria bacterium]|nr:glycosyltransferase family 4 protein [Deltaproteobacteria bacterium]
MSNKVETRGSVITESPSLLFLTTVPVTLDSFFRGQFEYWKQRGFRVIAVSSPGPALSRLRQREGIETFTIPMHRGVSPLKDVLALARLYTLLRTLRPAIIHASTPKAGLLGMISATAAGTPVKIFTVRGLMSEMSGVFSPILKWMERLTCWLAHAVTANSYSVAQELVENKICEPNKIQVLGNGSSNGVDAENLFNPSKIETSRSLELKHNLGIPESATVVTFVGRIVRDKGIAELAHAWERLRKHKSDCCLFIIGGEEKGKHDFSQALAELRNNSHVVFTGWAPKEEMPLYYSITDILVLPTYREGFPNVVLEASAMALPVVATRVTGCVDAVVDGVTGTLVPAKTAAALADAILRYLDDSELRKKHGKAGRERVLKDFRPEDIWEALYQEYIRLMKEKGILFSHRENGAGPR